MYPYSHPEFVRDRIAELHRQAERGALAVAARRARRARRDRSGPALPALLARARRALAPDRTRVGRRPASGTG